jgi:hypothetical protein
MCPANSGGRWPTAARTIAESKRDSRMILVNASVATISNRSDDVLADAERVNASHNRRRRQR